MGTSYSVKLVAPVEPSRLDETATNIRARLEELDERLSTFRETSEISRFNADPGTDWFAVSAETVFILRQGIEVSALSGGAFDMTVGPLVDLWGFGPAGEPTRVPAQAEIDALLASTGYELLQIRASPPAVRRTRPGVQIDLSAIAKGYAVDELTVVLDNAGVGAYLVEIGGEVRARGVKTDGTAWRIAVESPVAGTRLVGVGRVLFDLTAAPGRRWFQLSLAFQSTWLSGTSASCPARRRMRAWPSCTTGLLCARSQEPSRRMTRYSAATNVPPNTASRRAVSRSRMNGAFMTV